MTKINELNIKKQARGMSFHILKGTIESHFVAAKVNEENKDELSADLAKRGRKLMDIFMEEAWNRKTAGQTVSFMGKKFTNGKVETLADFKERETNNLEKRYAASIAGISLK